MIAKSKVYLFVVFFAVFMTGYLLLPIFPATNGLARIFDIFRDPALNFAFLIFSFLLISLLLTLFFYVMGCIVRGRDKERARIGEVLVSEGLIDSDDLQEALQEQTRRLGEILVKGGRITSGQRDEALRVQKKTKKKIGDVLQELGYATPEDVDWADKQMERRLGEILLENKKISDYDLTCATSVNKCIKDTKGNIIVVK